MKRLIVLILCLLPVCAEAGVVRFRSRSVVQVNAPGVQVNVGRGFFRTPVVVNRFPVVRSVGVYTSPVLTTQRTVFRSFGTVGYTSGVAAGVSNVTYGDVAPLRSVVQQDVTGTCGSISSVQAAPLVQSSVVGYAAAPLVFRQVDFSPSVVYRQVVGFPVVRSVFRTVTFPVRAVGRVFFRHHR